VRDDASPASVRAEFGRRVCTVGLGGLAACVAGFGIACAPEGDPVVTTMPPRSQDGIEIRMLSLPADSVESATFVHAFDPELNERVLYGMWGGIRARALVEFTTTVFEADTLEGATVSNARLLFQCAPGQGDTTGIPVRVTAIALGAGGAWSADSVSWPGPPLDEAFFAETMVENCAVADTFPEVSIDVPDALVQAWVDDPSGQNGLSFTVTEPVAMLEMASAENTFLYFDDAGIVRSVAKPRLSFTVTRPGSGGFTYTIASGDIDDTYVFSPDSAVVAGDPAPLVVARLPLHRILLFPRLPSLPLGSGVHRATVKLHALTHPRRDQDLSLQVFRLTSEWPSGAPVDSLVTDDGVIWHEVALAEDDTEVEVPITDLVQAWIDGTHENRGVLVRLSGGGQDAAAAAFAGGAHPTAALRPTLEIRYTTPIGGRP
jgi:hypothetical protein